MKHKLPNMKHKLPNGREYTKEEELYRQLLFVCLHYNSSSVGDAMAKCCDLLNQVRQSEIGEDFKKEFTSLFKDQVSKLYETHENYASSLKTVFDHALTPHPQPTNPMSKPTRD